MFVALSIRQPWVELILQGRKTIEVRTWFTQYRGELYLHAGKRADQMILHMFDLKQEHLSFGALVGKCEIYDCIEFTTDTWDCWRSSHLNVGPLERRQYAWLLRNSVRIEPKPLKGRLGLMKVDL